MPWVVCSTDSQARVVADPAGGVQPGTPGSLSSMGGVAWSGFRCLQETLARALSGPRL